MRQNAKTHFFLQNRTKTKMEKIAFCVITFEPIKIQTHSAPQNDRLNFSFVKDTYEDGEKLARNGRKMATYYSASFPPHYRRVLISHLWWHHRV